MLPFNTPYITEVDGVSMEFPKLLIEDYATLFLYFRKNEKTRIDLSVKEGLLDKDDGKKMMLGLAGTPDNIFAIQNAVGDPSMVKAILERSWAKSHRPMADFPLFMAQQDPLLLADIAAAVTRRNVEPPTKDDEKKAEGGEAGSSSPSTSTTG